MPLTPTQEELTRIIAHFRLEVRIQAGTSPTYSCTWRVVNVPTLADWQYAPTLSEAADAATRALRQWAEGDSGVQARLASWRSPVEAEPENPRLTRTALAEAVRIAQERDRRELGLLSPGPVMPDRIAAAAIAALRERLAAPAPSTLSQQQQLYSRYVQERELLDPDNYAQGDF